ncbi:MAG TPA: hypothetical protein VMG81_06660 [Thermoplasmata archaeon]|nr:hypothetical protein [Thermoplasmata archaeon]
MPETPQEAARELREEMIEVLKFLNRAEEEHRDVNGYELSEVVHLLAKGPYPNITSPDVERALAVLVGNRFAAVLADSEYAWERGRVVGPRYVVTSRGKEYLLQRLQKVDRIE